MRKIKFYEIIIISTILAASLFIFFIIGIFSSQSQTAVITVNSEIVRKISLESAENQTFQIKNVTIEIKDNQIRVLSSDCPDKICMHKGFISDSVENIICMPNRLIIEIGEANE